MVIRRTKIVCTLGPATDKPAILERLILAGCNVVRMNFSHGSAEDHQRRAKQVRQIAQSHGRSVAILGDLQGPKIRIAQFKNGPITLAVNDRFILDSELTSSEGDKQQVGIDYKELPNEVSEGDLLLLDDGRIVLQVNAVTGSRIETRVQVAGILSNNKGINREGGGLSAAALTPKDMADIQLAAAIDVDYLAVSFVRSNADVHLARKLLLEAGGNANIVAKIERAEAVNDNATMDGIIEASDAIMVARGDLGVEIGDAELMAVQKHLIERARTLNKAVITATQMMESMIVSPIPTRAEVFDVANAVLDGTDAVMLSAETAAGNYPVESVEAVHRVILGAESHRQSHISAHRLHENFEQTDESIAMATMYTANHMKGVKAVVSLTETGKTTLLMSRIRSHLPLFSFTRHQKVANKMALYRGVTAGVLDISKLKADKVNQFAFESLMTHQVASSGDTVVIAKGDHNKMEEGTNTMLIQKIKKTG